MRDRGGASSRSFKEHGSAGALCRQVALWNAGTLDCQVASRNRLGVSSRAYPRTQSWGQVFSHNPENWPLGSLDTYELLVMHPKFARSPVPFGSVVGELEELGMWLCIPRGGGPYEDAVGGEESKRCLKKGGG